MADKSKGPPPPPSDRDRASASGIPLQRYLAEQVRTTNANPPAETQAEDRQPWRVEAEEVPAGDGFLDMLLVRRVDSDPMIRMAVEVKRFYDVEEQRPMRLLFLAPRRDARPAGSGPFLPYRDPEKTKGMTSPPHHLLGGEFMATVQSRVAEHCILEDRRGNANMDTFARELLTQMEALSRESVGHNEKFAFVPVIVTNAELRLLRVGDVDLATGAMKNGASEGESLEFLRYEKTMSRTGAEPVPSQGTPNYLAWAAERVRTVYVVRASHFVEFLRQFSVGNPPWDRPKR